jgi:tRNA(fMet)-specific endonuclease VapC
MKYLLDTNILSYFLKGGDTQLAGRVTTGLRDESVVTSVICRAELRYGQALLAPDDKRRQGIEAMLERVPVLPWTTAAADRYGEIGAFLRRLGKPIGDLDTQIAAHALVENLILVTHNTRHFERVPGLKLADWVVSPAV